MGIDLSAREIKRKLFHLTGLSLHPLNIWFYDHRFLLWAGLLFLLTVIELARRQGKLPFLNRLFAGLLRPGEDGRLSGTFYYLWGVGLSFLFFPLEYALIGLWVLTLADTASALCGQAVGRLRLGTKTLEGMLAFWLTSLLILKGFGWSWDLRTLFLALFWAGVEMLPGVNDNLVLPLVVAGSLTLLAGP